MDRDVVRNARILVVEVDLERRVGEASRVVGLKAMFNAATARTGPAGWPDSTPPDGWGGGEALALAMRVWSQASKPA